MPFYATLVCYIKKSPWSEPQSKSRSTNYLMVPFVSHKFRFENRPVAIL